MGEAEMEADDATELSPKLLGEDVGKEILEPLPLQDSNSSLSSKSKERAEELHRQEGGQQQHLHCTSTQVTDLPVQVFEKLLLLLPIQTLFQARAVCKTWKSIISSSSFLPMWLETFHDHCFLMGYPDGRQLMAISDLALARKWHCSVPPAPPFLSLSHQRVSKIHPVASDGGLVLYFCHGSHKKPTITTLCVFNPFTSSFCMLPPVDLIAQEVGRAEVVISTDGTGAAYLVFVVGFTRKPNKKKAGISLSVYDSVSGSWVQRGITPEDDSIVPGHWSALHSNGVLYILSHVDGVISYDHARGVWGRLGAPLREIYVNGWLVHEKLLLHEGRLLLIGSTLERDDYTDALLHRLYIYVLKTQPGYGNSPYLHWEQFDRMPDELMLQSIDPDTRANHNILPPDELLQAIDPQRYAEHNVLPVRCYQCDDVVLLFFHAKSSANDLHGAALVAYRFSTKVWTKIPRWNAVQEEGPEERSEELVGEAPMEMFDQPHVKFSVVGFKPSLATTH